MQKWLQIVLATTVGLSASCSKQLDNSELRGDNEGSLTLALAAPKPSVDQTKQNSPTVSRTTIELEAPSVDLFDISIYSPTAEDPLTAIHKSKYSEFPYSLNLKEGSYRIVAEQGANTTFTLSDPLYRAEEAFEIERGYLTDLPLKAKIVPFVVDIAYSPEFATSFKSYYIEAEIDDKLDGYVFAQNGENNNRAYILPSATRLVLRGVTTDGKVYSTVIKEIQSAGKQLYTFNINILPRGHSFDIKIDDACTEILVEGEIPTGLLPDMPAITALPMEFYETSPTAIGSSPTDIKLEATLGFADIILTFAGEEFERVGLVAGNYALSNAAQAAAMKAAGISFEEGLAEKLGDRNAPHKRTVVDFAALAQKMLSYGGVTTDYTFACHTKDILDKEATGSATIRIHPPVFTMPEVLTGDVWSKSVTFSALAAANITNGNYDQMMTNGGFTYQISQDNATWSDVPSGKLSYQGELISSTTYYLRAKYRDILSPAVAFTTETITQVPNAGMEEWRIDGDGYKSKYHHYKPWNDNVAEWWNTSNPRCFTYNAFTASQYNSPTSVLYNPSGRSGKAAEIRSVRINVGGRENVVGKLLIGKLTSGSANISVSGNNNPEYITEGRPIDARPTKIRFWYKYNQYGTDNYVITVRMRAADDVVIAEKEVKNSGNVDDYTLMEIEIPYRRTDLKAASLYVCFASSDNSGFDSHDTGVSYPDGWGGNDWGAYLGSVLNIDDFELVYEK